MNQTNQLPRIDGLYRHYRGGKYRVICIATQSETEEEMVIYRNVSLNMYWARPLSMWFEDVGNGQTRFTEITDESN